MNAKARDAARASELSPDSLVWATVAVCVGGLAMLIGLIAVMKDANFDVNQIFVFTSASFLIILGAAFVFIRLLLRSKREAGGAGETAQVKGLTTRELHEAQRLELPEPLPSVTEHTTHTLKPVNRETK
ncbi:MAG TPA: hypothetical protein VE262_24220 [Blastocatellia bacterium]|nr:hypothetical protein [Blastocatellia bacterium]